ncbi:MAG: hypothetical protein JST68_27215 [Bacteroidetes bacterium]|nr:hypothetical protein [Bacteroidota bacterium]
MNQKLLIFLIIMAVAATAIGLSQVDWSQKTKTQPTVVQTKYYNRLETEIVALGNAPWNKFEYNSLKNRIQQNAEATPVPLITKEQQENLTSHLNSVYFGLLEKEIISVCKTADPSDAKAKTLNQELGVFPSGFQTQTIKTLSGYLRTFMSVPSIHYNVSNYTENSIYESATSNSYTSRIQSVFVTDNVKDNSKIKSLLRDDESKINMQRKHDDVFRKLCRDSLLRRFPCSDFRPNNFYYNKCKLQECNL